MSVGAFVQALRDGRDLPASVAAQHTVPPRPARFAPYPEWIHAGLRSALQARGILELYEHQRRAADALNARKHVVVATPTASGKSLCYHIPVLDHLFREGGDARALYLFPTKALARDQMAELESILAATGRADLTVAVYDGDTPPATRRALRESGSLVITNPHMLHAGILPNHTKWQGLFTGLRYIVIDELHTLSGVYGSHVANVVRRLKRICHHYGSDPVFCAASATISNPGEHARRLLEAPVEVVDEDASAAGAKHYLFMNPHVTSETSGMRVPVIEVARQLARQLIGTDLQTIYFCRSRNTVEILLKYLRDEARAKNVDQERIAGYRGGYLPDLRRRIESGLASGSITTVVATSALELGIDIGSLDVCVLVGYPGTVSSTFQRAGRVGRRNRESAVVFLARSFAMDQYLMGNPGYLFDKPREAVSIDPQNPIILTNHVKCSAFELPFELPAGGAANAAVDGAADSAADTDADSVAGDVTDRASGFGEAEHVEQVLDFLADDLRLLVREGRRYHFSGLTYPAQGVSLTAADMDNVVIMDSESGTVLGEVDRPSAIVDVYEGAIYGHQGEQYQVLRFEYADRRAYVKKVDVDYYTEADTETEVRVLHDDDVERFATYEAHRCEVHVSTLARAFKKIRFYTRENVGVGEINLPPEEFETEACVLVLDRDLAQSAGLDLGTDAGGLRGVGELIQGLVPLFVRVDPADVRVTTELLHPHFERPAITIYDRVPNGVGLSEKIFRGHRDILDAALGLATKCVCATGCPACIGPSRDQGRRGKTLALLVLSGMLGSGIPGPGTPGSATPGSATPGSATPGSASPVPGTPSPGTLRSGTPR